VDINRRNVLAGLVALKTLTSRRANAQDAANAAPKVIPLWPGHPPGAMNGPAGPEHVGSKGQLSNISQPRLIAHIPAKPNGTAAIVMAGGGYRSIEVALESEPCARWLASIGIAAFELIYRLPREGWGGGAPFFDGHRALRLVRSMAARFGFDAARIGVIGFSAGGHLAGLTAVRSDTMRYASYARVDAADDLSPRPDFAGLIYPVLTMMPPWNHTQSFRQLFDLDMPESAWEALSVERHVGPDFPPVFLAQAADDPISPVQNSLLMFDAVKAAGMFPELHIFPHGKHGWGMGVPGSEETAWPGLFETWLSRLWAKPTP
jgi:acetyl esterase/lipase